VSIKRKNQDAPTLPGAQPTGSGAVPGSEQAAEETFGERLKASAAGTQVAPGVNDGTAPELQEDPNTDAELAEAAEEPMVVYTGESSRREITAEQWAEAGVEGMPTVLWERQSGHKVPANVFSDQALQVLRQDGGFQVP
jgi:hypothetical protein